MNMLNALLGWVDERFPLTATWKQHLSEYYAPKNFNFWYFFGSLAMLVLVIQIVSGISVRVIEALSQIVIIINVGTYNRFIN